MVPVRIRENPEDAIAATLARLIMASFGDVSPAANVCKYPNILITGTPGVGKTSTAQQIAEKLGSSFRCVEVGALVKEHKLGDYNEEFDTMEYDEDNEDKLLDLMDPMCAAGGCIVDFHTPDMFPESWFELVLVLRTSTDVLYDRLTARGYNEKKRTENMECEIMQVVLDEAHESYDTNIVHEVPSNTLEEMESNVARVESWVSAWHKNNKASSSSSSSS